MRMRRIRNHDERKQACLARMLYVEKTDEDYREIVKNKEYLDYFQIFGNDNPVIMEIGCGKGRFVLEMAKRYPAYNFLAVEVNSNVIIEACEAVMEENIDNVYFMRCGAELLEKYIPAGSIMRIYLNHSCPFPKNRYENRRLTNLKFMPIYSHCLCANGEIHQKTDNMHFFEYSIEQFSAYGAQLKNISLDLHNSDFEGNIVTEYEAKFISKNMPIYRLEAVFNQST
ncbi:MAG: tRNA (guanosine(46)-N7)-methyltransferase TrmB [Clostridia bacterium]|nr:tRNA (guanosine(46)-N7)-methyltransferase TrmB [Clostridia bacterium]